MTLPDFLQDADGYIPVAGHRVGLQDVVYYYNEGHSAEALAEMFPTLKFELSGLEMDLNYAYEGTIENGEVDFVEGNGEGGGAPCH